MPPALVAMSLAYMLNMGKYNFIDGYILWSIVCELFYYSLYPFFLLLSRKVPFEIQFLFSFLISFVLVVYLGSDQYGNANIYGPELNWLIALPSWLLGTILAKRVTSSSCTEMCSMRILMLWRISIAMVASMLYWLTLNTCVGYYLTMNLFAILIFFWIRAEISTPKKANGWWERAGRWSYSIYLFHMVFLELTLRLFANLSNEPLITIPVVLSLSYLAYIVVEKPSHNCARLLFDKLQNQCFVVVMGKV